MLRIVKVEKALRRGPSRQGHRWQDEVVPDRVVVRWLRWEKGPGVVLVLSTTEIGGLGQLLGVILQIRCCWGDLASGEEFLGPGESQRMLRCEPKLPQQFLGAGELSVSPRRWVWSLLSANW